MKLFSQNIETLRLKKRLSKTYMAKEFGVATTSYSRWESGTECNFDTLVKIAAFYDICIHDLLTKDLSIAPPDRVEPTPTLKINKALTSEEMELIEAMQQTIKELTQMTRRLADELREIREAQETQAKELHQLKKQKSA